MPFCEQKRPAPARTSLMEILALSVAVNSRRATMAKVKDFPLPTASRLVCDCGFTDYMMQRFCWLSLTPSDGGLANPNWRWNSLVSSPIQALIKQQNWQKLTKTAWNNSVAKSVKNASKLLSCIGFPHKIVHKVGNFSNDVLCSFRENGSRCQEFRTTGNHIHLNGETGLCSTLYVKGSTKRPN